MKKYIFLLFVILIYPSAIFSQLDTIKYHWPVPPLTTSQGLNATFCEFRNTLSSDHFHNAVDIGEPDGNPVYPCLDGIVHSIVSSGSNSYVSVRTEFGGKWKRITYLHIVPNGSLYAGQEVTQGVTILGTIYSGMGHTHLIERELVNGYNDYAAEINNVRENGGLDPFIDTWAPALYQNSVEFRLHDTEYEIPPYGLAGDIDIIVKAEEVNGTSSINRNNGTYILGYRVWSADTSTVMFEPDDAGVKYRFDRKPLNEDVHNVFVAGVATLSNPVYWLTNGDGADYINNTQEVNKNYFDTDQLPADDYVLEIFSEDTRHNTAQLFYPITITGEDVVPPGRPVLMSVINNNKMKGVTITWENRTESDFKGCRLYYTNDTQLSTWHLAADETTLTKDTTSHSFESPLEFLEPTSDIVYFFKITAVDSTGNESEESDIYSRSTFDYENNYPTCLIVDGFDRTAGSWSQPTHSLNIQYFGPLTLIDSIVVSSCANDAVIDGSVNLNDFDSVIWFVGDESTADNTFTTAEQGMAAAYLENGGNIFVTGSEIGWDLDRSHSSSQASDTLFYRHYLKARFVYDGDSNMNTATGVSGSIFNGLTAHFGQIYEEDWPDDIDPAYGSSEILHYNTTREDMITPRKAGVAYSGNFGAGTETGNMVYFSFPFETIASINERTDLMRGIFAYFDLITGIPDEETNLPVQFKLRQNYPNPFNPSTQIEFQIPEEEFVSLKIYDVLGREVDRLFSGVKTPGVYKIKWNASKLSSGIYFARLTSGNSSQTIRMMLLK